MWGKSDATTVGTQTFGGDVRLSREIRRQRLALVAKHMRFHLVPIVPLVFLLGAPTSTPKLPACARHGPSTVRPIAQRGSSNLLALAERQGRTLAMVGDQDERALRVVEVDTGREVGRAALSGEPSSVIVAGNGQALVALRDRSTVAVVDVEAAPTVRCEVPVDDEPVGLAEAQGVVLVSAGWGQSLSALDARDLSPRWRVPVAREPRAVLVSEDESTAFVSHATGGSMTAVHLATRSATAIDVSEDGDHHKEPRMVFVDTLGRDRVEFLPRARRRSAQGFALASIDARVLAPQVMVEPGDTSERSSGYGSKIAPISENVAVVDGSTLEPIAASTRAPRSSRFDPGQPCLLPRAAALDPTREWLFVSCLGADKVIALDAMAGAPSAFEVAHWPVPPGALGLAVDTPRKRLVVWSQFDQKLAVISLEQPKELPAVTALARTARDALADERARGRKVFHASGDPGLSTDGRACASCHPDGRDDGFTWSTPEGPRQTPSLAGRIADTAPHAWTGEHKDLETHLRTTLTRIGGSGLERHELSAVIAYVRGMQAPGTSAPFRHGALVARGRALFHAEHTQCAHCHGTDGQVPDGMAHDVESRAKADVLSDFDTPSLRLVGKTAPYFHDGRFASLRELLVATAGSMGHTEDLSPPDVDALEAYLRSL